MSSLYTQDTQESLLQIGIWTEPVSGQLVQALKRVLQGSQAGHDACQRWQGIPASREAGDAARRLEWRPPSPAAARPKDSWNYLGLPSSKSSTPAQT